MRASKYQRNNYLIDRQFQLRFVVKFCLLVILSSLVIMLLLYYFSRQSTTVVFENTQAVVKSTADFLMPLLLQTVIVVSVITGGFAILLTLLFSHRIAGPLYRFKKELELVNKGDLSEPFSIRQYDQLKEIAGTLNSAKLTLKEYLSGFKADINDLEKKVKGLDIAEQDKKEIIKDLEKISREANHFKT